MPDPEAGGCCAAPSRVVHYVAAHGYAPPEEVVRTVERLEVGDAVADLDAAHVELLRTARASR